MFSASYCKEIKSHFEKKLALLDLRGRELMLEESDDAEALNGLWKNRRSLLEEKKEEILRTLAECTEEEAQVLMYLYGAMPLSDMLDYGAEAFLDYARHAVFLWKEGPYAGKVPERLFTNYVVYHRIHTEDIVDTRSFFYDKLKDIAAGKSMEEAAVAVNYWCAGEATYQTTDHRTINPVTMFYSTAGRCGEEAPFAVTALRSLGIPAREVFAPSWSHCDDNHAWTEVWCEGTWHFLGSCEPEESLDKGWFGGPASRAMMVQSEWFGPEDPVGEKVDVRGMSVGLNQLETYARTAQLNVRVTDKQGNAVPAARVDFWVLNYSRFSRIGTLIAGEGEADCGRVRLTTGIGDLLVSAYKDGCYGESLVSVGEEGYECTVTLFKEEGFREEYWEMDFHAPSELLQNEMVGEEERIASERKLQEKTEHRQHKKAGFYVEEEAERVLQRFQGQDRQELDEILHLACGNMGEIIRFLDWDFGENAAAFERLSGADRWKLQVLKVLREKDYWDIDAGILAEYCISALPYAGSVPEDIFYRYLLNPRVADEPVKSCRRELSGYLDEKEKARIRNCPPCLYQEVKQRILPLPDQEYAMLVTSALGCLRGGIASTLSGKIFCVHMYRSLGIPARLRPMDRCIEYYRQGAFYPAESLVKEVTGRLLLQAQEPFKLTDWKHWSVSRLEEGSFFPIFPGKREKDEANELEMELKQGHYRIVTSNRLPNGGQYASMWDITLEKGEEKRIVLKQRSISAEDMLDRRAIDDFQLMTAEGKRQLHELAGEGRALFLWLELTREPTEHILNEIAERGELFGRLKVPVYFVIKRKLSGAVKQEDDPTLKRACAALPQAKVVYDDFGKQYETLAYQVHRNPGKLPLAVITDNGKESIYSDAGYNVGMADVLLRIL